jgi:hypothetical protein
MLLWEFILHAPACQGQKIGWHVAVLLVFVISTLLLALADRWGSDHGGK